MNEENLRNRIRTLIDKIQNEADPVILNRCRSIFRQEVSFFHRSYMAAYLLLLSESSIDEKTIKGSFSSGGEPRLTASGVPGGGKKNRGFLRRGTSALAGLGGNRRQKDPYAEEGKTDPPRVLSEEEAVQLFVSIGRNRKVFPREILALIIAKVKLPRDDIGMIRILDNYSFVQIRNSSADKVIETLNGQKFRGRILTVNYARTRREGEDVTENNG